jgi:hypothetical protein
VAMVIHANGVLLSADEQFRWVCYARIETCMNALRDLSTTWLLAEASFEICLPVVRFLDTTAGAVSSADPSSTKSPMHKERRKEYSRSDWSILRAMGYRKRG